MSAEYQALWHIGTRLDRVGEAFVFGAALAVGFSGASTFKRSSAEDVYAFAVGAVRAWRGVRDSANNPPTLSREENPPFVGPYR